jgi:hypothetical protein
LIEDGLERATFGKASAKDALNFAAQKLLEKAKK